MKMYSVPCHGLASRQKSAKPLNEIQWLKKSRFHTPVSWKLWGCLLPLRPVVPGIALYDAVTDHVLLQSWECPE